MQYYYVIERLGLNPCFRLDQKQDQVSLMGDLNIAQFFRITLLAMSTVGRQAKVMLQITIATPGESAGVCHDVIHIINTGRQSWREIKN